MQDIAALGLHGVFDFLCLPAMGKRQGDDEFFAQVINFAGAYRDVFGRKFFNNLAVSEMLEKKRFAHVDHDIITKMTSPRH